MTEQNGSGLRSVGEWAFDAASGELRRGGEVRRLEPRAAKALEMLCDAHGGVVSQEQLIARVWNGRSLSENSVAVVIGQLRRALDDDQRPPRLIETIPKRGYRLGGAAPASPPSRVGRGVITVILLIFAVVAAWAWVAMREPEPLMVGVSEVVNETGDPAYAPLARATSELLVDRLARRGFAVNHGSPGDLEMRSKLIIWDGRPFLSLSAVDTTATVRWSAMLDASPGKVPPNVERAFDEFAAEFPPAEGAGRVAKGEERR